MHLLKLMQVLCSQCDQFKITTDLVTASDQVWEAGIYGRNAGKSKRGMTRCFKGRISLRNQLGGNLNDRRVLVFFLGNDVPVCMTGSQYRKEG